MNKNKIKPLENLLYGIEYSHDGKIFYNIQEDKKRYYETIVIYNPRKEQLYVADGYKCNLTDVLKIYKQKLENETD